MKKLLASLLCITLLAPFFACEKSPVAVIPGEEYLSGAVTGDDYRETGPYKVTAHEGIGVLPDGSEIRYTTFMPELVWDAPWVMVGHGFMADRGTTKGLAMHWTSWGLRCVTLDFIRSTFSDGNHYENGLDMVSLRQFLDIRSVIYAGFSAGGLSALVAAYEDTLTVACLGLDMVDNGGLGASLASGLTVPVYGLISAASDCNAQNNGLAVYSALDHSRVIRVEGSTHCHFQFPFDSRCPLACGTNHSSFTLAEIQEVILAYSTVYLLYQAGRAPHLMTWWDDDGINGRLFLEAGRIRFILM